MLGRLLRDTLPDLAAAPRLDGEWLSFVAPVRPSLAGSRRTSSPREEERLVPLINGSRELLDWWVQGPRWEFDDRINDPLAPLFPSERRNIDGSSCAATTDTLRDGLADAVGAHLPTQIGLLSPHLLRHFAASDLYRNGMDVVAIQEVLGHAWLSTTMISARERRQNPHRGRLGQCGQRAADRFGSRR